MNKFFDRFRLTGDPGYDLWKLIDRSEITEVDASGNKHIICDIDKTYLETEFDNFFQIARTALQSASDKITVDGATEFLLACRWGQMDEIPEDFSEFPRPLHFVSSSPPQMRKTLESKFRLDGLDWTSDSFKNQAYNIRRGRFDLLRQQLAYKIASICELVQTYEHQQIELYLIGDSSEDDQWIYLGLKLFLEGHLTSEHFNQYLCLAGVDEQVAASITEKFAGSKAEVKAILIREVPGSPLKLEHPLAGLIFSFGSFLEAALHLSGKGLIPAACIWQLVRSFHNRYGYSLKSIGQLLNRFLENENLPSDVHSEVEAALKKTSEVVTRAADQKTQLPYRDIPDQSENPFTRMNETIEADSESILLQLVPYLKKRSEDLEDPETTS